MISRTAPMRLMFSVMPMTCTLCWVVRPYFASRRVKTRPPTSEQAAQPSRTACRSAMVRSRRFCISRNCSRLVMMSGNFCTLKLWLPSSSTFSAM